jgi:hypothetical protein
MPQKTKINYIQMSRAKMEKNEIACLYVLCWTVHVLVYLQQTWTTWVELWVYIPFNSQNKVISGILAVLHICKLLHDYNFLVSLRRIYVSICSWTNKACRTNVEWHQLLFFWYWTNVESMACLRFVQLHANFCWRLGDVLLNLLRSLIATYNDELWRMNTWPILMII